MQKTKKKTNNAPPTINEQFILLKGAAHLLSSYCQTTQCEACLFNNGRLGLGKDMRDCPFDWAPAPGDWLLADHKDKENIFLDESEAEELMSSAIRCQV